MRTDLVCCIELLTARASSLRMLDCVWPECGKFGTVLKRVSRVFLTASAELALVKCARVRLFLEHLTQTSETQTSNLLAFVLAKSSLRIEF